MIKFTVSGKTYQIPKVPGQKDIFTKIDWLAFEFFRTDDKKRKRQFFTALIKLAKPFISGAANYFTQNIQDSKELEAILMKDLWRLINRWKPREKYLLQYALKKTNESCKFHHLMLRQLRNQSINEVQRLQKPQERKRFVDLSSSVSIDDLAAFLPAPVLDPLNSLAQQDFIDKLTSRVDEKTAKILKMVLEKAPLDEIKTVVGHKATPAIKRRQEACRPIVINLLTGSFSNFMGRLFEKVTDEGERLIMSKYCSGETVEEISKHIQLHSSEIRKCVNKYKPLVLNMLR